MKHSQVLVNEAVCLFAGAKSPAAIAVLLQYAELLKADQGAYETLKREYNVVRRERQWLYGADEILRKPERFASLPRPSRIFAPYTGTHAVRTMQPGEMALWRAEFVPFVAESREEDTPEDEL